MKVKPTINLYDTKSYYYVTVQGNDGKRIATMTQPTGNSTLSLNTFDDHQFHELDLVNKYRSSWADNGLAKYLTSI